MILRARALARMGSVGGSVALVAGLLVVGPLAGVASAAPLTFSVNTATNAADNNVGNGLCDTAGAVGDQCTLRAAIQEANANVGADTINFSLLSPYRILLDTTVLPPVTSPVTINGASLPGFSPSTGVIVRVDGNTVNTGATGLVLDPGSDGSTVRGLEMVRLGGDAAIDINSDNNLVVGNYLGTTAQTGLITCPAPNSSSCANLNGVHISGSGNTIGGTTSADRNVISNNVNSYGIAIVTNVTAPVNNTIKGNYIGTKPDGATAAGNYGGVYQYGFPEPTGTVIGGTTAGAGNVISGNPNNGVDISYGTATIQGNTIGLNAAGTAAVPNGSRGVVLSYVHDSVIGGATAAARNVISGNGGSGLDVTGDGTTANVTIQGNYVGTSALGTAALPNGNNGIALAGTNNPTITGNVAVGVDGWSAISYTGCTSCVPAYGIAGTITNNVIGSDPTGTTALGTWSYGLYLNDTAGITVSGNLVGGTSSNGATFSTTTDLTFTNNKIGTDVTGELARANATYGVATNAVTDSTFSGNIVSASGNDAMTFSNSETLVVSGNFVGTDDDGLQLIPNGGTGIVFNSTDESLIGGSTPTERNIIGGNGNYGIYLGADSERNTVTGNHIGVGSNGTTPLANGGVCGCPGVRVDPGADRNVIGDITTGRGNVIANSNTSGVEIYADRATVRGNSIKGNGLLGIDLGADGVTANDVDDPDVGANRRQNFPVVATAASNVSGTQVHGSLNSKPSTTYQLDFYGSPACDGSGNGEGSTYLGSKTVSTDPGGDVTFVANLGTVTGLGTWVTTTATDPSGRTSEFSECTAVGGIPTVSITPTSPSPSEGAGSVAFTVNLSASYVDPVTVVWQTADGTATSADYAVQAPTTLTFAPGETSKPISVALTSDTLDEDNETFQVALSNPDNALLAPAAIATVTIVDDDPLPTLSVNDASNVAETGGGTQTFTVTLSAASSKTVTVVASTDDGTAAAPADYTAVGTTLTFAPGETTKPVAVTILDDNVDEANESYSVELHGATNSVIGDGSGAGTIVDDDTDPTISIAPVNPTVAESGSAAFTVTLSQPSTKTVTVSWSTANGTATSADYTPQGSTLLTFTPGQTSQPISVPITTDALDEADETFVVSLSGPSESYLGVSSTTVTITDDDATPSLSVADATGATETPGGSIQAFTVTLSAASGQTVQVSAATAGGTAAAEQDFTSVVQGLTFLPGETTKTINVTVLDDFEDEAVEAYEVRLASPSNATISDSSGSGSITDNDVYPTVSVVATNSPQAEGTGATFSINLSGAYGAPVTVRYRTVDGTAVGADYNAIGLTTVTFLPGEVTKPVSVPTTNDVLDEADESFSVVLDQPTRATLGIATASATITDNDATPTVSIGTNATLTEGTGGNLQTTTITLSAASGQPVQVVAATATTALTLATPDADYVTKAELFTFNPGEVSKSFTVTVIDDLTDEPTIEDYEVRIYSPVNAVLGTAVKSAKIGDNDDPPTASVNDVSVLEGSSGYSKLNFTVTFSAPSERAIGLTFSTQTGTANGSDFVVATNKVITVNRGVTTATFFVKVKGDVVVEPDEGMLVNLTATQNVTIADGQGAGTILNDD